MATGMVAAPTTAATTCSYSGATFKVTVKLNAAGDDANISRDAAGKILVNGGWCGNQATVTTTDTILVTAVSGGAGNNTITINLANGGFKPGATDEIGTSDEIEFTINAGAGTDLIVIKGTAGNDYIRLGQKSSTYAPVDRINLNANEPNGVDSDVAVLLSDRVWVFTYDGADQVSGAGGGGTGSQFLWPLWLSGGNGPDSLTGGIKNDTLHGAAGVDTLKGNDGNDTIVGLGGPDTMYGDAGKDSLNGVDQVNGNDTLDGGAGVDDCVGDPNDAEIDC
jgi:Ca2+-binding RTX toxin-like protein